MKKPKIFLFTIFVLIFTVKSSAQIVEVKAGVNFSTMLSKDKYETYSEEYQMVPGLLLGATAEFPLNRLLSFEPGLLFSSKGYKLDSYYPLPTYRGEYPPVYDKTSLRYVEIPLSLKTSGRIKQLPVLFTLGPYIGIGLNGKTTRSYYNWTVEGYERRTSRYKMGGDSNLKRLDFGLQAGVGMEIKRMVLRLNYSYGLASISQVSSVKSKNRTIGLALGYKFTIKKVNQ